MLVLLNYMRYAQMILMAQNEVLDIIRFRAFSHLL